MESKVIETMLREDTDKIIRLKTQLNKLNETMNALKADYDQKYLGLITELNKTVGSTETLTKLLHAQKDQPKQECSDSNPSKL